MIVHAVDVLLGAITLGSALIALFFLRFWRSSRDRFFLFFALSFALEAVNRLHLVVWGADAEAGPTFYGVRLICYLLILGAILDKNWPHRS